MHCSAYGGMVHAPHMSSASASIPVRSAPIFLANSKASFGSFLDCVALDMIGKADGFQLCVCMCA